MNWIDVTKQNPRPKQKVLAVGIDYKFKDQGQQMEVLQLIGGEWVKSDGEYWDKLYITHWMTLPAPPSND